jgi:ribosomal protein S18 acetylase RimI-like enzyme
MDIRTLTRYDDFHHLFSLSREFFSEYTAHHPYFFKLDELKDEQMASYFLSFCDTPSRRAFIALEGEMIVGYSTVYVRDQADYWEVKKVGEISDLMVHKDFRQQGIGRGLLSEAKIFLSSLGMRYFTVYTAVENQAGINFYAQNGLAPLYTTLLGEI